MKTLEQINLVGRIFADGAKAQLNHGGIVKMAAFMGLAQGLKYKGSIRQGAIAGAATLGVMMAANGISTVIANWDRVKAL